MTHLRPSGYEGSLSKMMLYGEKRLYLNMEQIGFVGGVRRSLMLRGSDVENLSIQVWIYFKFLVCSEVGMDLGCYFSMISGAGNNLLSFNSQIFSGWHV